MVDLQFSSACSARLKHDVWSNISTTYMALASVEEVDFPELMNQ